jgi:predicted transcriptional regulator
LEVLLHHLPPSDSLRERRIESFRIPTMTDLLSQAKKAYKEKGIAYVALAGARMVLDTVMFPLSE